MVPGNHDIRDNPTTIQNIRLWRQGILQENFQSSQRIRQYYEFKDVDVDLLLGAVPVDIPLGESLEDLLKGDAALENKLMLDDWVSNDTQTFRNAMHL